jgi:7,8-dihydropterin-6-yl-methyl-4-(beta-D-ribofuranosyl)aminobenzene 5'-phosphate synthase
MLEPLATVQITILVDNVVRGGDGCLGEHGLSLFVKADRTCFLFDVGQSGIVLGNAARLGCDLSSAATVVVSHGHYDHAGALPMLLQAFGPKRLLAHPDVFTPMYVRRRGHPRRAIGLPFSESDLTALGAVADLSLSDEPQPICPGAMTTGLIPQTNEFETIPEYFGIKTSRGTGRDGFAHEQAVVLSTAEGLVVLVGCSHRGVVNTIHHAMNLTGIDRVAAVVGGLHLAAAPDEQVSATIQELRELKISQVVACHCTGFGPAAGLAATLGDSFCPGGVGFNLTL